MENLSKLLDDLKSKQSQFKNKKINYKIPNLWIDNNLDNSLEKSLIINPFDFFISQITKVINGDIKSNGNITYNMFIRASLSFEHELTTDIKDFNINSFKNPGTFLKAIALLPYLQKLGVAFIHILPVNSIGIDGKKGELGSPYAVRNHYKLDENLAEEILDISLEEQYKAFIEAVHLCNMKLIQEFVFRTSSIDSDLTLTNPNWFYWIKTTIKIAKNKNEGGYSSPQFSSKQLEKIKERVEQNDLTKLIAPDEKYRAYFTNIPLKTARVEDKIIGVLQIIHKPKKSNEVQIAPAFADWPPDDNQPAWSDVTYFRLFDHKDFNYIAYNTVRMYDNILSMKDNRVEDLWEYISNILPFYINEFGIDGAMIDMGHSLPIELLENVIAKAKEAKSDFILWEENFGLDKKSAEVYDSALGYVIFDAHIPDKLFELIKRFENNDIPIDFFATPENHNTPRAISRIENKNFSIMIYAIFRFLKTTQYIHSGFEICEKNPINTGLQFTDEEIEKYANEGLALFDFKPFDWTKEGILSEILKINQVYNNNNNLENISINRIENSIFEINLSGDGQNLRIMFNHSNESNNINENIDNVIYSNQVKIEDNSILFDAYGIVLFND